MPEKLLQQEFSELVTKILFPAFIIGSVSVMVEIKNNKNRVSWLNAFLSVFIGIGGAYVCSGVIFEYFQGGSVMLVGGAVTLLTEKTVKFIMYKFNIDTFLTALLNSFFDFILNLRIKK